MSDNYQSNYNKDKSILYKDSPMYKQVDKNGNLKELINSDAVSQAFKIWIVSGKGEKIRTNSGGWLIPFIGKEVTEDRSEQIKKNIILGLEKDFYPPITVSNINVFPDKNNFRYIIHVEGYNTEVNIGINTVAIVDVSP